MPKLYLVTLICLYTHLVSGQTTVFLFEWEGTDPTQATVGINATSVERRATIKLRVDNNTRGLAAATNGNGNKDIALTFADNPAFNVPGIDLSFDYQKDDITEVLFSRNNFIMGSGGMNISYRVTEAGGNCSARINSGTYPIPTDDIYRKYRFRYDPNSGQAILSQNGITLWSNAGAETPRQPLCWIGDGSIVVGSDLDGNTNGKALLDNLHFQRINLETGLPVELTQFTATTRQNQVELYWQTASERENDYFEVERSVNAGDWKAILRTEGQGTSHKTTDYRAVDTDPPANTVYYRLRQVDYDGTTSLSKIVALHRNSTTTNPKQTVYPNPTIDYLYVRDSAPPQLYNAAGHAVPVTIQQNNEGYRLTTRHLASGTYFLRSKRAVYTVVKR